MDWGQIDSFGSKVYRRSKSLHSKRFYLTGVGKFQDFCQEKKLDVTNKNVYNVLDSFVQWLDDKGNKAKTIADYMSAVRKYLAFVDIEINPTKFRDKVTLPTVTKIADQPLRIEDVEKLLTRGRPNPKMRALILTLLSSGMRIGEALSIKVSDFDLNANPATINIRAEYAKTRVARIAYISDEAKEAVKKIVGDGEPSRLVFHYSGNLWQRDKVANRTFRQIVERAGLGEKLENHRIHRIHFHIFRKFFLTKAVDKLGDHAGHALCGHGFYMDTYYKKSEEERKADYLKLMPLLTVAGKGAEKIDVRKELAKQFLIFSGFQPDEVEKMEISEMTDSDIQRKVKQKMLGAMANNGNRQKVIPITEVKEVLGQGWELVRELSTGEAVVQLP